jgi:hypothetical protein
MHYKARFPREPLLIRSPSFEGYPRYQLKNNPVYTPRQSVPEERPRREKTPEIKKISERTVEFNVLQEKLTELENKISAIRGKI